MTELGVELEERHKSPDSTILEAMSEMLPDLQMLAVVDPQIESPVFLISYPRILRYVMSHFQDSEGDDLLEQSIGSLDAVHQGQVEPIDGNSTTVLEALQML